MDSVYPDGVKLLPEPGSRFSFDINVGQIVQSNSVGSASDFVIYHDKTRWENGSSFSINLISPFLRFDRNFLDYMMKYFVSTLCYTESDNFLYQPTAWLCDV